MQGTFVSWTQTTAIQSFSVFWCTHAAIKRLPVVNTSPLHMQSTHGATHNKPDCKKKKGRERKRKKMQTFFHITDGTETMFCFTVISHYSYLHESDSGCGCGGGGGVWVWGDTRTRTFEKPFHTAWSGDMDPMRQRRGTRYFKVT